MNVDYYISCYRNFILSSWNTIVRFTSPIANLRKEEFIDDWMQANWEILVESSVCTYNTFLEVYGNGADCNGDSSRVCYPEKMPTHKIICKSHKNNVLDLLSGNKIAFTEMDFDRFVSWDNNYYNISPPFDFVLLNNNNESIVVNVRDVYFEVKSKV